MNRRHTDIALAMVLLLGSVLFYAETFQVRNFPGTRFGAEIWPRAILIAMGLLSLLLLIQGLRASPADKPGPGLSGLIAREGIALTVFACFCAFLLLVPRIGAYPAGALFVFAVLSALGPRNPRAVLLHLAIALGMTLVLWVIFSGILKVIVPSGRWTMTLWQAVRP